MITENPNPHIMRRIILTMKAPLYLNSATYTAGDPVPHLQWDDSGNPKQNGTMDIDVLVQIPNSVNTAGKHGLLQNGHGLFGGKEEGQNGYLVVAANDWHWITLAVDLFGFANGDVGIAVEASGTPRDAGRLRRPADPGSGESARSDAPDDGARREGRHQECERSPDSRPGLGRRFAARLPRRQPGRHHGRHLHVDFDGRDARPAGRAGNAVQRASEPQHRLRLVQRCAQGHLRRRSERANPLVADPALLGSQRARRIRAVLERRYAAEHAVARRDPDRRARRPSGDHARRAHHGPRDRREALEVERSGRARDSRRVGPRASERAAQRRFHDRRSGNSPLRPSRTATSHRSTAAIRTTACASSGPPTPCRTSFSAPAQSPGSATASATATTSTKPAKSKAVASRTSISANRSPDGPSAQGRRPQM